MVEKRRHKRVKIHTAIKISNSREGVHLNGFIENISENGMGVVLPELIVLGKSFTCNFSLGNEDERLNLLGTPVYVKIDANSFYYYGFRFEHINDNDRQAIQNYIINQSFHKY